MKRTTNFPRDPSGISGPAVYGVVNLLSFARLFGASCCACGSCPACQAHRAQELLTGGAASHATVTANVFHTRLWDCYLSTRPRRVLPFSRFWSNKKQVVRANSEPADPVKRANIREWNGRASRCERYHSHPRLQTQPLGSAAFGL